MEPWAERTQSDLFLGFALREFSRRLEGGRNTIVNAETAWHRLNWGGLIQTNTRLIFFSRGTILRWRKCVIDIPLSAIVICIGKQSGLMRDSEGLLHIEHNKYGSRNPLEFDRIEGGSVRAAEIADSIAYYRDNLGIVDTG